MQPSKCSRCLGGSQGRVREEFLTASSGNLRLCSFCGFFLIFFFSSLGGQGWAFSSNVTNPILRPCRAGEIITQ